MGTIVKKEDYNKRADLKSKVDQTYRHEMFPVHSGGVVSKDLMQSQDQARVILEEARQEAEQIRLEARQLLQQVEEEKVLTQERAEKQGLEEGKKKVLEYLNQLYVLKDKLSENIEAQLLKLSFAIAEKVVGKVLERDDEGLLQIVKQAVGEIKGAKLTVRLRPEDYQRIKTEEQAWVLKIDADKSIVFKEDPSVKLGGCLVESEIGTLDAQLETQLFAIKKALGL
ncbi:MAG: hypothetical protein HQM15_10150 [Deltaproteobacteria bacterium]|nr:hypothetical protein [Deltaproteobacteria bacterium]